MPSASIVTQMSCGSVQTDRETVKQTETDNFENTMTHHKDVVHQIVNFRALIRVKKTFEEVSSSTLFIRDNSTCISTFAFLRSSHWDSTKFPFHLFQTHSPVRARIPKPPNSKQYYHVGDKGFALQLPVVDFRAVCPLRFAQTPVPMHPLTVYEYSRS